MKILNMYAGFNGICNVGQFSYFAEFDVNGVDYEEEAIFNTIKNYNYIVLKGDIYDNKEDIKHLIKKTTKYNKKIKFEIRIHDIKKLNGLNASNITFVLEMNNMIIQKELEWFINFENTRYIFFVETLDEYSNVMIQINNFGIDKKDSYVSILNAYLIKDIRDKCYEDGLNFCPNFEKILW
jgi:hypothetical protein